MSEAPSASAPAASALPVEPTAEPAPAAPRASAAVVVRGATPLAPSAATPSSTTSTAPLPGASAAAAPVDLPQCRKLLALYCSPAFKATDGGGQCTLWQPTFARFLATPAEARAGIEDGCQIAYGGGVIALKERQRQIDAGLHP